jgi:hypothetical protein
VGKPEKGRQLGSQSRRWEHGIETDLRGVSWQGVDWIQVAQDRNMWRALVNTIINLWVLATRI